MASDWAGLLAEFEYIKRASRGWGGNIRHLDAVAICYPANGFAMDAQATLNGWSYPMIRQKIKDILSEIICSQAIQERHKNSLGLGEFHPDKMGLIKGGFLHELLDGLT